MDALMDDKQGQFTVKFFLILASFSFFAFHDTPSHDTPHLDQYPPYPSVP